MPGFSYGLPASSAPWVPDLCKQLGLKVPPAWGCPIGSKLAQQKDTVCSSCYADGRGFYSFTQPRAAQIRRLVSLWDDRWVSAITDLIEQKTKKKDKFFRWHDSGDLLGLWHLKKIVEVAENLEPKVKFWLPTREVKVIKDFTGTIPKNLVVRVSSHKVDQVPLTNFVNTSTVHSTKKGSFFLGEECPAYTQGNQCGTCRMCWNKDVPNVSYRLH